MAPRAVDPAADAHRDGRGHGRRGAHRPLRDHPILAFLGRLLLFEKGRTGDPTALRTVWQRGQRLWISSLALTPAWIVLYVTVVDQDRWSRDLPMTRDLLSRSITHGIVPGLAGGPWDWQRWAHASPWATPPIVAMGLGWLCT